MSATQLPTVMTAAGLQPQAPAALNSQLIFYVAGVNSGYTVLPGGLIEDISSTDTGALVMLDQARVDVINSVTPLGANPFLLYQLGAIYGVTQGQGSNASVYLVFTGANAGFTIIPGFVASDGTNQYIVQEGGILNGSGISSPLYAIAVNAGTFPIPANTVTQLVTSVPSGIYLSVTNPAAGIPATSIQTISDYRYQVVQAGTVSCQGTAPLLKTLLSNIPGVQPRLVSVRNVGASFEVLVGGGDPYQVANAIFQAVGNPGQLIASTLLIESISSATSAVVTTNVSHGYAVGNSVVISGSNPSSYNGTYTVGSIVSDYAFSINLNSTGLAAYVGSGIASPNSRNVMVSINDYPDTYIIPVVVPFQQKVTVSLVWNTSSVNYVSATAVAQDGATALVNYINSIPVGAPINLFELQNAFQVGVAGILPTQLLTRMVFSVAIDGVTVNPSTGTGIIQGDVESYLFATTAGMTISQG